MNFSMEMMKVACLAYLVTYMAKPCLGEKEFNVTEFGAVSDGITDNSKAFIAAWEAACAHKEKAKMIIPEGVFYLHPVSFSGPCANESAAPTVELQGTLKAPSSLSFFPNDTISWIEFRELDNLKISGSGLIDGHGDEAWDCDSCAKERINGKMPISLLLSKVNGSVISDVTIVNSKGVQLKIQRSENITVHDVEIYAPEDSPNTDGVHSSQTNFLNLTKLVIATGDDCIAIGQGTTNAFVSNVFCGPGHGISVGSLGKHKNEKDVVGLLVKNCTLSNTDNGVRIKTWRGSLPGRAAFITFEDIVMRNVSNPIIIDQGYCQKTTCQGPSLVKIHDVWFKNIRGTSVDEVGVNLNCSDVFPCERVNVHDVNLEYVGNSEGVKSVVSACNSVVGGQASGILKPNSCF